MILICIFFSLLIGIIVGMIGMHYKNRNLLKNHKILYNELNSNKDKLNEYQKKLNNHFTCNIELLNKIANDCQILYQNMTKSANFFLPNIYTCDKIYTDHIQKIYNKDKSDENLSIQAPLDYSDNNIEISQKKYKNKD